MTVQEYRERLIQALKGCLPDEIESAVEYYTELIEESEDPAEQMDKLGSPEELAERIKRESGWIQPAEGIPAGGQTPPPQGFGGQQGYQQTSNGGAAAGRVIALILTFPFWIWLFSILISLFFVIWGVYIAFPCGVLSTLVGGIAEMKTYPGYGLIILLSSILFAGLSVLLAKPAVNLTRLTAHGTARFAKFLFAPSAKTEKFVWKKMSKIVLVAGIGLSGIGLVATGAAYGIVHPTPEKYAEKLDLVTKEYDLTSDHSDVMADIDIGAIIVNKSTDGKAKLKAVNIEEDNLTLKDENTLSIKYKQGTDNINYNINFDLFGIKSRSHTDIKFELYLPEKEYENFKISASLGKVEVNDMTADSMKLESDCGAIKLNDSAAGTLDLKDSLGAINLSNVTADSAEIHDNCGAVKIKNTTIAGKLSGELSLGSGKFNDVKLGSIDIELDCGDFDYEGEITESGNIKLDVGNAKIKLEGQGYNVHADTDTGNVNIDDSLKSGSINIEVHNDCGNITVKAA